MSQITINRTAKHKVSTIFLDYAEPYINFALVNNNNPTCDELDLVLQIPWIIWNAYYQKQHGDRRDYNGIILELVKNIPGEMKQLIKSMQERRATEFNQYDYMIGDYKFRYDDSTGEMILTAESRINPNHRDRSLKGLM